MRSRLALVLLALVAPLLVGPLVSPLATLPASGSSAAEPHRALTIEELSNRADLVSAGDVLVAVRLPQGVQARDVRVTLGDRNVTERFAVRADGRFLGLVRGLEVGRNVLRATAPEVRGDRAVVVNHPNGGPVFSGPQTERSRSAA